MAGNGAAAFAHQRGDGNTIGLTAFPPRGHHVVGVVLQRIVRGGRRCGTAAVLIDAESTAHIQEPHRGPQSGQLHIDLPRLLESVLENGDVVDLAADVEVQQA